MVLVRAEEEKYQLEIEESFHRLSETSFRALRMKLPRSKQLINWEVFALQGNIGGGK